MQSVGRECQKGRWHDTRRGAAGGELASCHGACRKGRRHTRSFFRFLSLDLLLRFFLSPLLLLLLLSLLLPLPDELLELLLSLLPESLELLSSRFLRADGNKRCHTL